MGVKVIFHELCPDNYSGQTFCDHAKLASLFEGKVVAIDGSMFICQATNGLRIRALQDASNSDNEITQMLRYGAHPVVVLDGVSPEGKRDVSGRMQRSESRVGRLVQQLCKYMAIPCLVAPSEGEAFCAALNAHGRVDCIWTKDVVDALMFGAKTVMRECSHGKDDGRSNQATLCYKSPDTSEVAVLRHSGMAHRFGCTEEQVADVVTCFSALVGTDFNGGLQLYGPKKSEEVTAWLQSAWQQQAPTAPFESFLMEVLSGSIQLQAPSRQIQTFLKCARDDTKVDVAAPPFTEQLQSVFDIVREQRRQSMAAAAKHTREQLYWDGSMVQHAELVSLLEQNQPASRDSTKDKNPAMLRVMNLEAERMLRSNADSCTACARIVSVAKAKEFGKDHKLPDLDVTHFSNLFICHETFSVLLLDHDATLLIVVLSRVYMSVFRTSTQEQEDTDGIVDSHCYQYLVNIELNPSFSGFDGSNAESLREVKIRLQQYLEETILKKAATWVSGARMARKSALVLNWPKVLQDWKTKKAGKKQASNTKVQKAADRAQKQSEKSAAKSQLGTLDSFLGKAKAPFTSKDAQCKGTPQDSCKVGGPTARGLGLNESTSGQATLSKGISSTVLSTPPSKSRKNIFKALATPSSPQKSTSELKHSDSERFQQPMLSSDSLLSDSAEHAADVGLSDTKCAQSREDSAKRSDVCEPIGGLESRLATTSPLKKRAVSLHGSEGTPSPIRASPSDLHPQVIDLVDSSAVRSLQPLDLHRSCVDLTCDSDCD